MAKTKIRTIVSIKEKPLTIITNNQPTITKPFEYLKIVYWKLFGTCFLEFGILLLYGIVITAAWSFWPETYMSSDQSRNPLIKISVVEVPTVSEPKKAWPELVVIFVLS